MSERISGITETALKQRYFGFPEGLMYHVFLRLSENLRSEIIQHNRIVQTDTYNRTMEHIFGAEADTQATYVLQMRRSPHGFIIAMGMRRILEEITRPITQSELDFAHEYYEEHATVPYFRKEKWQNIISEYGGRLPIEIDCVPEGTALLPGDPVMRITGPSELVAHFEPYFHRVFYPSMVATTAFLIGQEFPGRFIEVGKRGTSTEEQHLIAMHAMLAAGGIDKTSNDAAAAVYPELHDVGTMGHRYIQGISIQNGFTEMDAFRRAIESTDSIALLVDLTDSYRGIDWAIQLKKEYRHTGKKIFIRLDSGDVSAQALYTLRKFAAHGFMDPSRDKVIVENIESIDEMRQIDRTARVCAFPPESHILYGAGGLLVSRGTTRNDAASNFKLSQWDEYATEKFSEGKKSLPGKPALFQMANQRMIGQVSEDLGPDLLVPAYRFPGRVLLSDDIHEIQVRAKKTFQNIHENIGSVTQCSPGTLALDKQILEHYEV